MTLLGDSTVPMLVDGAPAVPTALPDCGSSAVAGPVAGLVRVVLAVGVSIVAGGKEGAPAVPALLPGAPAVPALLLGAPAVPALLLGAPAVPALSAGAPAVPALVPAAPAGFLRPPVGAEFVIGGDKVGSVGFIVGLAPTGAVGATPVAAPDGPGADAVAPAPAPAAVASDHAKVREKARMVRGSLFMVESVNIVDGISLCSWADCAPSPIRPRRKRSRKKIEEETRGKRREVRLIARIFTRGQGLSRYLRDKGVAGPRTTLKDNPAALRTQASGDKCSEYVYDRHEVTFVTTSRPSRSSRHHCRHGITFEGASP